MVSALDQFTVAACTALVVAAPIAESYVDAKCAPAGMICGPATPVLPHGGEGSMPSRPPATVQVLLTGTGRGTGTDTASPPAAQPPNDWLPFWDAVCQDDTTELAAA
jgi:hypothetical protein